MLHFRLNFLLAIFYFADFNLRYFHTKSNRDFSKQKLHLDNFNGSIWNIMIFCLFILFVVRLKKILKKSKKIDTTHTHHNDWDNFRQSTVFRFSLSREATSLCWDDEKSFYATHPNSRRWTREIYIVRVRAFHTEKTASSTLISFSHSLSLSFRCVFSNFRRY